MITSSRVRKDLQDIRYYYSRKEVFDKAENSVGKTMMLETIECYNNAICMAPPKLYDVYVSLYLHNNTQESLSEKLGYTFEYISRLNTKLISFFQKHVVKKEENANV